MEVLRRTEKETRGEKTYTVPSLSDGVSAGRKQRISPAALLLFGMAILLLLLLRNVSELKNGEKLCRKETLRDFPVIVHLLALYMGAFPSRRRCIESVWIICPVQIEKEPMPLRRSFIWIPV